MSALRRALLVLLLLAPGQSGAGEDLPLSFSRISLHLFDAKLDRVGELRYRGGLALDSEDEAFGGLSGLLVSPDGSVLTAISDKGDWFEIGLRYDAGGRLAGATGRAAGRLADPESVPLGKKQEADAEALARLPDGSFLVTFERHHRAWRYAGPSPLRAPAQPVPTPDELADAPSNSGLEAALALSDGRVLLLTEGLEAGPDRVRGWVGRPGEWGALAYLRHGSARPTAATLLPDGDVVVLERGYSRERGLEVRLRRLAGPSIVAGATLDGEVLAELRPPMNVDNFEALDSRTDAAGKVLLYLLSDDNFSRRQRTLLMLFELEASGS